MNTRVVLVPFDRLLAMMSLPRFTVSFVVVLAAALGAAAAEPVVDFNRDIRPILANHCFTCHGPDEKVRKADLRIDTRDGATTSGAIVPGKPTESALIERVSSTDTDMVMPPQKTGKKLTPREITLLSAWVKQGAPYANHWAYVKPVRPAVPSILNSQSSILTPIDAFVFARLEKEGLKPQPEADRYSLARRVSLDLTGLPPSVEEVDPFVADKSADAYEKYVDRLLAKPAFGEHWARMWLDLARYADSAGYANDPSRTIWSYRDYVIRSYNLNKPFDQFTIEQIAGDMLPKPTREQLIATAFHRNTLTNSEGGTNDEEFRNVAVVDRVNTTLAVWMGTSMACAQCHTHKFDPISQTEYFRVFAFLNNTEDADRADEEPLLTIGDPPERKTKRTKLDSQVKALEKVARYMPGLVQGGIRVQLETLNAELAKLQPDTVVPIMRELPVGKRRVTKLQFRGNFMDLGDVVSEGVPAAFHALPKDAPLNRLAFAKWLVSGDNPLTARVMANRFWEAIFGTGIVRTSEEFGTQGELPSHPELLDWLAVDFANDWNIKRFLKLLVTSAAYRQSSRVTPALLEKDPDNRLLSRGPRFRLTAEMVRDQALAASGLLSTKMYGAPVKPPQPSLGLNAAFGKALDWQTSPGEDKYRRALYTEWRRTNPYPSMAAFDAPSREACTLRRNRSNTPLQALVTLNDPVYIEAAQALAKRMAAVKGTPTDQIAAGFRMCVSRPPSEKELARLVKLFEDARAEYDRNPDMAAKMANEPNTKAPKSQELDAAAARIVVANVLMNLDEMFLKR